MLRKKLKPFAKDMVFLQRGGREACVGEEKRRKDEKYARRNILQGILTETPLFFGTHD